MVHYFDTNIAKKYGVQPAIILNNLYFWIEKNKANNKHFYDGHYWTYNSMKAFSELFPYMTERQINYAIKKLVDDGLVIKGNYNKSSYDRTCWYAITKYGYSILQNCEMVDNTNLSNGNDDIVKPIPDINTDNNISKKERKEKEEKTAEPKTQTKKENKNNNHDRQSFDEIIERYMTHAENDLVLTNMLKEFLKIRYLKNKPLTNEVLSEEISRLFDYGKCNKYLMREIANKTISNCWATFFPLSKEEEQRIIEELQECE